MTIVVDGTNRLPYNDIMEKIYLFRGACIVEFHTLRERGRCDGRETDPSASESSPPRFILPLPVSLPDIDVRYRA